MIYKYCPFCGSKLVLRNSWDEGEVPYCSHDDKMFFDLPKPCLVVAVIKENKILLLKQSYIYKNSKVLLSGYIGINETVEEAVCREIKEESGIEVNNVKYLGSDFVKDKELLMLTYMAKYKEGELCKSSEVEFLEWVNIENALEQMQEDKIGQKIVKKVLRELDNKKIKAFKTIENSYEL
ncbi:NAD(+) diphosphatase [Clostridium tarantellae]|uniref:NAD(+) diphosphatase n=1 Tax=Clostridium tarantellae TaxID=39493 RepID=A0A6I1MVK4_9CLOT|nr:NUDIX domain-containing protein [Clostridium tarantellae]MPQ44861.1 NUDIX domain-containing protein [Clostridium tarantellae]